MSNSKFFLVFIFFSSLFLQSCEEDEDSDPQQTEENMPPSAFDLVFLSDNATDVVILPYLTWTPSVDNDGGTVTYQVLLDPTGELTAAGETEPSTVIGEGITTNGWTMTQGLAQGVEYTWRVIAFDGQGGSTKSTSIRSFITAENGVANSPPGAFDLVSPANFASDVPLSPNLTWLPAVDPDGDPVFYDVYLVDEQFNGNVISNMNPNTSTIPLSLDYETFYYWDVVAYDVNGASTPSTSQFTFETIAEPTPGQMTVVTFNSPLQSDGRIGHQALVHNGLLYVIGGRVIDDVEFGNFNDVWTYDGTDWTQVRESDPSDLNAPKPSEQSQVVSYNGLLYAFNGERNTIQTSTDGAVWEQVPWEGTHYDAVQGHQVVVFDNNLYLIGGSTGGDASNDVWKSSDGGINWEQISDGSFPARRDHQVVVDPILGMFLMGGFAGTTEYNDVWFSENGAEWEFIGNAPWTPRANLQCVFSEGDIIVVGGDAVGDTDEIWLFNTDLRVWGEFTPDPDFAPRESHQVVDFNNDIYILFGKNGTQALNDIWKID
ncbi:MAG: hypothetical protein AAGC47_08250 [Bacteroidota bacterium]